MDQVVVDAEDTERTQGRPHLSFDDVIMTITTTTTFDIKITTKFCVTMTTTK